MSRSPVRRRRPFSLLAAVAVLAFGWLYNQFIAPPGSLAKNVPAGRNSSAATPQAPAPDVVEPAPVAGKLQSDVVVHIADGDSFVLKRGGRIRMIGVDCPEQGQAGGREAAAFSKAALLGKTIEYELCAEQPRDRFGRGLGYVYLGGAGAERVLFNAELVRQGYARVYRGGACAVDLAVWNNYYEEARRNKRGLFATLGEVPDALAYRNQHRRD